MPQYIVKNQSGTFDVTAEPAGFRVISALENRLFICESPTVPSGEFVVEFPEEQQAQFLYYPFPNGKKLWFDPFVGKVAFGTEIDNKNRRAISYSPEQLSARLAIMKWLMLNVWIPDKARMYGIVDDIVADYIAAAAALTDDNTARTYIDKNLYYNL